MKYIHPIVDLHCDLLCYLSRDPKHTPYDLPVRCAIPQLKVGNVKVQIMAIFTETKTGSSNRGRSQAEVFKTLPKQYSDVFEFIRQPEQLDGLANSEKIGIIPAIENASSFCEEDEELGQALENFTALQRKIGKVAYISMTWNTENRFGGGALTKKGLKEDGKRLLDYIYNKKIVLDLSHASDYLAYDILNYLDKSGMRIPLVASHSNMRAICEAPRNLPDDLAKEILMRKGLVGLNFVRYIVGKESPDFFIRQLEHILSLGGEQNFCFGADFFHDEDLPKESRKPPEELFFPSFDNAGAYPKVLDLWRKQFSASDATFKKICYENVVNFLKTHFFTS